MMAGVGLVWSESRGGADAGTRHSAVASSLPSVEARNGVLDSPQQPAPVSPSPTSSSVKPVPSPSRTPSRPPSPSPKPSPSAQSCLAGRWSMVDRHRKVPNFFVYLNFTGGSQTLQFNANASMSIDDKSVGKATSFGYELEVRATGGGSAQYTYAGNTLTLDRATFAGSYAFSNAYMKWSQPGTELANGAFQTTCDAGSLTIQTGGDGYLRYQRA